MILIWTPSGVQFVPPVVMMAEDGKRRKIQAATLEEIFRIIQSIPEKRYRLTIHNN